MAAKRSARGIAVAVVGRGAQEIAAGVAVRCFASLQNKFSRDMSTTLRNA